ncbi:MAG: DUF2703 domain-containing protein [Melioribacteraceae bacterium]|nr:DUF2703 domain-containing protein [Melioribacteraceae bacterium]
MNKILIEIQHFSDCPNSEEMIARTKKAILSFESLVDYKETLVEDNVTAEKVKFRGSPTLLINGEDFENLPEPFQPNLTCRIYSKGITSLEEIKEKIQSQINRNIN